MSPSPFPFISATQRERERENEERLPREFCFDFLLKKGQLKGVFPLGCVLSSPFEFLPWSLKRKEQSENAESGFNAC
jgi:hypothetical protein